MSDFPAARFHKPVLSSISVESIGSILRGDGVAAPASAVWPAANRAIFVPIAIAAPYPVRKLWWANGTAVAGNVDCGIYSADGTRLISAGATAQAGTSAIQSVTLGTPFLLLPGLYYLALAFSSASGTAIRVASGTLAPQMAGCAQMATAEPLPATATFASIASSYIPIFGIASSPVI